MTDGFPDGQFKIINQDTGFCLTSQGYSHGFALAMKAADSATQRWYVAENKDAWGNVTYLLTCAARGDYGELGLGTQTQRDDTAMTETTRVETEGTGSQNVHQWVTEDGFVFIRGEPNQVLTVGFQAPPYDGSAYYTELRDRGESGQQWRFA